MSIYDDWDLVFGCGDALDADTGRAEKSIRCRALVDHVGLGWCGRTESDEIHDPLIDGSHPYEGLL